jgi:hypothetical protein
MSISVTNRATAPALRGQDILVTVNQSDNAQLANFTQGQHVSISSSGAVGYISEIDLLGYSFWIKPRNPDGNLASSSTPGALNNGETIVVG